MIRLTGKRKILLGAAALVVAAAVFLLLPSGGCLDDFSFSTAVFDREGELLRIFLTDDDKYRIRKPLNDFPPRFIEMVLLKEDKHFYYHPGINPAALFKAAWNTYVVRDYRMGASTITMQLARLKYGLDTDNVPGKLGQIFRAFYLELKYSKQEILEAYMNLAPCGANIEGFPAAAHYYYHKTLNELTLSEMFFLAVLPQSPNQRAPSPERVPEASLEARKLLFSGWLESHPEDSGYGLQMQMPVSFYCSFPFEAPHVSEFLRQGAGPGGSISSTIDSAYQNLMERHVESYLRAKSVRGVKNCSALLLDFTAMEVLGAVGSADFFDDAIEGQVNGFDSKRSPGSTLKPFIYAMAIEQGIIHPNSMLKDAPTSFGVYTPDNYQSDFRGPVKAWEALVHSRNIPALTLASKIKDPDLYDFLAEAGVGGLKEREHYGLSIVLGSAEVTMLELASMYAALANDGVQKPLSFTTGGELPNGAEEEHRLLTPEASILTLRMLQKNPPPIEHRPREVLNSPIAYKTGTSIGFKDCWSVGVFDRFVLCVWLGNFNGDGNPAFLGRETAAPLLFSIADSIIMNILEGDRYTPPIPPPTITRVEVCSVSGGIPNGFCPHTEFTDFIPGVSPITRCMIHREVHIDSSTGYRTDTEQGPGIVTTVREFWPTDMLDQFRKAGLPRLLPPPYAPEDSDPAHSAEGMAPDIMSPLDGGTYIVRRSDSRKNSIPLVAASDADTSLLYWFADNIFIGRAAPGGSLEWSPEPGAYSITVLDDLFRSRTVDITVETVQ